MYKPPSKIVTALMAGIFISFFILIPFFSCFIMLFCGAIAVEWHIQRSEEPVEHIDAFVISLISAIPPLIVWHCYWFFIAKDHEILFSLIFLSIPGFAFISSLSGFIMCGLSRSNRNLRRYQPQQEKRQEITSDLSANANINLLESVKYRQEIKSRDSDRHKVLIKNQTMPTRCEICHQTDQFNPATNHCNRCASLQ